MLAQFPETIPAAFREQLGITSENQCFDTVIMGRRTYEVGLKDGMSNPYPQMKQYVVSQTLGKPLDPAINLIPSEPLELVRTLKRQSGQDIWLCGGSHLATDLFSEIGELILKVHPILLGVGIPLFAGTVPQTALELAQSKIYPNGFMLLHYKI